MMTLGYIWLGTPAEGDGVNGGGPKVQFINDDTKITNVNAKQEMASIAYT